MPQSLLNVSVNFKFTSTIVGGKILENSCRLNGLEGVADGRVSDVHLFYKDLGPQVRWATVFYLEYAGPLIIYSLVWAARCSGCPLSAGYFLAPMRTNLGLRTLAGFCYIGHFAKRLLETRFVHRFSNSTMPLSSCLRNCIYYWLFAFIIAYFTTHPLYTPPCEFAYLDMPV